MNNLTVRTISGAVYVVLLLGALSASNAIFFVLLFSLFAILATIEFNLMTQVNRTHPFRTAADALATVWVFLMGYLIGAGQNRAVLWIPIVSYVIYILVRSLFTDEGRELKAISNSLFPLIYIGLPFALSALISVHTVNYFQRTLFVGEALLTVFICVWANDCFAYLVGSAFGKRKLIPRLSPHKSVEGFIGGMVASALIAMLFPALFPYYFGGFSLFSMAMYGLFIGLLASIGDLFESMLKRRFGVKDSGWVIPGHGGILDRIDSFLFAVMGAFVLFSIIAY